MKVRGKLLSIFMATLITVPLSALPVRSADNSISDTPTVVEEALSLREQNVKHFHLSDGTYSAVVYDTPVHYRSGENWVEIDNTLVSATLLGSPTTGTIKRNSQLTADEAQSATAYSNGTLASYNTAYYENNTNDFQVQIPQQMDSRMPIAISHGENSLRFRLCDISSSTAEVAATLETAAAIDENVSNEALSENSLDACAELTRNRAAVSFASVKSGIDLKYSLYGQALKEDIVFREIPTVDSLTFAFTYTGMTVALQEDRSVLFRDETGEVAFVVAAPFMFDSGDGYSRDVAVSLAETAAGCLYTVTPDRDWLRDPERVYPVTLDPNIYTSQDSRHIHDNGVQESDPNTNYITANRIYVGSGPNSKEGRMYLKLTQWPSAPGLTVDSITDAELHLTYYGTASYQTAYNMDIDVYKLSSAWDTNTITWNNQTGIGGTIITHKHLEDCRNVTERVDTFDVTEWVRSHYYAPSADHGIRLQPRTVSGSVNRVCYISSDYSNAGARPVIRISYNETAPGLTVGKTYYLRNSQSGRYLDVPASNSANGTDLMQHYLNGGQNQQFRLAFDNATGNYFLSPVIAPGSAVEITDSSGDNNAVVQIWEKPSSGLMNSQRFRIVKIDADSFALLSYVSNYTKGVAIYNASNDNYASVVQYGLANRSAYWFFETADKTIITGNCNINANYNRANAASYALTYARTANLAYEYIDYNDCTNFVSQCLVAGGVSQVPSNPSYFSNKADSANWFYKNSNWISYSFTSATYFNEHFGEMHRYAFQTIEYPSGPAALEDIDFLLFYLKNGDVIQLKAPDNIHWGHSMIIYDQDATCYGIHREEESCNNYEKKEMLYAQHTDNYDNGHLRWLLENTSRGVIFTKIKNDI